MPSAARTLVVPVNGDIVARWPAKNPADILDYYLDFTAFCADLGSTIVQVDCTVLQGDTSLIILNAPWTPTLAQFVLAGGTTTMSYALRARIIFANSYVAVINPLINVSNLAPPVSMPGSVVLVNGAVFTVAGMQLGAPS